MNNKPLSSVPFPNSTPEGRFSLDDSDVLPIKYAGHAVVGVLVGCRPQWVSVAVRDGTCGGYHLAPRQPRDRRGMMVALAGHVALSIYAERAVMAADLATWAEVTDLASFADLFTPEVRDDDRQFRDLYERLCAEVRELLLAHWASVLVLATELADCGRLEGPELTRIVRGVTSARRRPELTTPAG